MPAANSGWSVITPVEESVTFKMAHSQGSLPVIRNVYYGLWSHPVSVCVCGRECVFLHAHYSVSWRSVWVLKAIWLSDMNLHFPFLLLINVLQADVLCSCSCSRLHSKIVNADFIDVLDFLQARITNLNLRMGAIQTATATNVKILPFIWNMVLKHQTNQWKCWIGTVRWPLLFINKERQLNTHHITTSL